MNRPVLYHLSTDLLTFACMESSSTSLIQETTKFVKCQLTLVPLPLLLVLHQGSLDIRTDPLPLPCSTIKTESLLILWVCVVMYLRLFSQIIFIGNNHLSSIYLLFMCSEMPDYYCKVQELCVHLCERLFIWFFYSIYLGMNLYVADSNNIVIRQINLATSSVTTFAGGAPMLQ